MIELLISSGVGRYLEFKILERIYVEVNSDWEKVPFSKEDIFLSQTVGIVDKRRLMKFLTFCLDYENQPQEYISIFLFSFFSSITTKYSNYRPPRSSFQTIPFSSSNP